MYETNELYMARALELSKYGEGHVNPNPMVGCVIVSDGRIIGEGYHKYYGSNHAEVDAIENVQGSLTGASMYVTLEPCCHYGKTPPCTERIISSGITEVYIGTLDPNPLVAGKGAQILRDHGIQVHIGLLETEILATNEIFIKYITTSKPFITLKSAISLDGKIATHTGDSKWISCEASRKTAHLMRNKYMGIMVGINTILKDNPRLNIRIDGFNGSNPIKIIVDSKLKTPLSSNVLREGAPVIIGTTKYHDANKRIELESMGVKVLVIEDSNQRVDLKAFINQLGEMGIDSILLEGGGTLAYSALHAEIIDKVTLFIAPIIIGGDGLGFVGGTGADNIADAFQLDNTTYTLLDKDVFLQGYVRKEANQCLQE